MDLAETQQLAEALRDPLVSLLLRQIGANVARITTSKKPLLWSKVKDFYDATLAACDDDTIASPSMATQRDVRDAFALTLGMATGSRVSELLSFIGSDIVHEETTEGREYLSIRFRHTKTRQTPFDTHQPFITFVTNPTVIALYKVFDTVCGWEADGPVWV
jgi:integrase